MAAVEIKLEGLGHELLLNWAPWARDDSEERHSWSVRPRVDRGYHGDPPDQFWVVDKIVGPHRRDRTPYWNVVSRWYLGEVAMHLIVKEMGWSETRVMMNLVAFASMVEREYRDMLDAVAPGRYKISPQSAAFLRS